MIHNSPIVPHNVKVSVDDVVAEYQLTPLPVPCDEHETEPILLEKNKEGLASRKMFRCQKKLKAKVQ
ncbi:hypothetical protein AgCh_002641 [Apium graveolens]